MELIPNPLMVLLQLVPFLATAFALNKIIFQPMLAYLEARDAALADGKAQVEQTESDIAGKMEAHEANLATARTEAADLRASARADAQIVYDDKVGAARTQAESEVADAVATIAGEADVARKELSGQTDVLAQNIAGRVLGRAVEA
jgi:F-type H+-transporting ATPase subunit b